MVLKQISIGPVIITKKQQNVLIFVIMINHAFFMISKNEGIRNLLLTWTLTYVTLCAIWYHLYNLKNVKNTHRGVLLLVNFAALLKVTLLHGCFHVF